jgi:hypothetical protein
MAELFLPTNEIVAPFEGSIARNPNEMDVTTNEYGGEQWYPKSIWLPQQQFGGSVLDDLTGEEDLTVNAGAVWHRHGIDWNAANGVQMTGVSALSGLTLWGTLICESSMVGDSGIAGGSWTGNLQFWLDSTGPHKWSLQWDGVLDGSQLVDDVPYNWCLSIGGTYGARLFVDGQLEITSSTTRSSGSLYLMCTTAITTKKSQHVTSVLCRHDAEVDPMTASALSRDPLGKIRAIRNTWFAAAAAPGVNAPTSHLYGPLVGPLGGPV